MLKPAANVIEKCGGHRAVAEMAGVDLSRVHRWTYPRERGGTGGIIPSRHQAVILAKAQERGLPLQAGDFFDAEPDRPNDEAAA